MLHSGWKILNLNSTCKVVKWVGPIWPSRATRSFKPDDASSIMAAGRLLMKGGWKLEEHKLPTQSPSSPLTFSSLICLFYLYAIHRLVNCLYKVENSFVSGRGVVAQFVRTPN